MAREGSEFRDDPIGYAARDRARPLDVTSYLAVAGDPKRLHQFLKQLVPRRHSAHRLNRELDCPDLVVFASPETALVRMADDRGLIIGRLFADPSRSTPLELLDRGHSALAASTAGRSLLEHNWGSYVAFVRNNNRIAVVRDPAGAIPAFHAVIDRVTIYFSDLSLCADLGLRKPQISEGCTHQTATLVGARHPRIGHSGSSELKAGTIHVIQPQ